MQKIIKYIYCQFLDLVFPQDPIVKELEEMNVTEFLKKVELCVSDIPEYDFIKVLLPYKNPYVRKAIWQLKFKRNEKVARLFAELLFLFFEKMCERAELPERPLLLPIPLAKKRQKERGYNQIALILNHMKDVTKHNMNTPHGEKEEKEKNHSFEINTEIFVKTRETLSQTQTKTKEQRLSNIQNCFLVTDAEKIKNRNIILIDDVLTTGSTLSEASDSRSRSEKSNLHSLGALKKR
jgi:predicted amidophosphoribosyltransferase